MQRGGRREKEDQKKSNALTSPPLGYYTYCPLSNTRGGEHGCLTGSPIVCSPNQTPIVHLHAIRPQRVPGPAGSGRSQRSVNQGPSAGWLIVFLSPYRVHRGHIRTPGKEGIPAFARHVTVWYGMYVCISRYEYKAHPGAPSMSFGGGIGMLARRVSRTHSPLEANTGRAGRHDNIDQPPGLRLPRTM